MRKIDDIIIHLDDCSLEELKHLEKTIHQFRVSKFKKEMYDYQGDRCFHCKYFNGKSSCVGVECTNPNKIWKSRTARYHQPSTKACKKFERDSDEAIQQRANQRNY